MLPFEIESRLELIQKRIEALGAEFVEITFKRIHGRGVLALIVDKPGGITLDECVKINNDLSHWLDELSILSPGAGEVMSGPYFLEVSSPGLDRPMKTQKDFARTVGELVRVVYHEPSGKTRMAEGRLERVLDDAIEVALRDGSVQKFALDTIQKAVRQIQVKEK